MNEEALLGWIAQVSWALGIARGVARATHDSACGRA